VIEAEPRRGKRWFKLAWACLAHQVLHFVWSRQLAIKWLDYRFLRDNK
jgi:hypothetical protein